MAAWTCCRVAAVSCLVLCVSLLLPRTFLPRAGGRQEPGAAPPEELGSGLVSTVDLQVCGSTAGAPHTANPYVGVQDIPLYRSQTPLYRYQTLLRSQTSLLRPLSFQGYQRDVLDSDTHTGPAASTGKLSRFPPRMHSHATPDGRAVPHFPRSHLTEAVAKAKAGGGGSGSTGGSGRGLVGQIIPIYGFGIFLYILYILFKLASKGRTTPAERKCPTATPGNMKRKITDYELIQLQERLRETEEAMEKLINRVGPMNDRTQNVTTDQEKMLLQQLREITRVMKEGKFIDDISPEKEAEEAPYMTDWEGYPEETYPVYDNSDCFKRKQDTILVDYPDLSQPSPEELAERMVGMEDEEYPYDETLLSDLTIGMGGQDLMQKKDDVTLVREEKSDLPASQSTGECCCCCTDDPAVIAENAGFHSESCSEIEETSQEDLSVESENEQAVLEKPKVGESEETGTLRKRNTKVLG